MKVLLRQSETMQDLLQLESNSENSLFGGFSLPQNYLLGASDLITLRLQDINPRPNTNLLIQSYIYKT